MASELGVQTIQHTNGTDALTIDSSGRILTPARPAFSVRLSAHTTNDQDFTTLGDCPFDTIDFNVGSCVAISNNVATFTAPVNGIYHFHFTLSVDNAEGSGHVNSYLFIDNTADSVSTDVNWRHIEDPQSAAYWMGHSDALMQLNANQTVNPKLSVNVDTTIRIRRATRFFGFLVG